MQDSPVVPVYPVDWTAEDSVVDGYKLNWEPEPHFVESRQKEALDSM